MERADPTTLADTALTTLAIRGDRLANGLAPIPAGRRNLRGITRWSTLEHIECNGVPTPEEIAELRDLPNLRDLAIRTRADRAAEAELKTLQSQLPAIRVTRT
jgi:hypothetical protein